MFLLLCTFQEEMLVGKEDTLGIGRPFGKATMIRSNLPNKQAFEDTFLFHANPT